MLKSVGCKYVIIGHSERRISSTKIKFKNQSAFKNNLKTIYCIGEKLNQIKIRNKILDNQLKSLPKNLKINNLIIAYEPVWAIGSGKTPTTDEINNIHYDIRNLLSKKVGKRTVKKFQFCMVDP